MDQRYITKVLFYWRGKWGNQLYEFPRNCISGRRSKLGFLAIQMKIALNFGEPCAPMHRALEENTQFTRRNILLNNIHTLLAVCFPYNFRLTNKTLLFGFCRTLSCWEHYGTNRGLLVELNLLRCFPCHDSCKHYARSENGSTFRLIYAPKEIDMQSNALNLLYLFAKGLRIVFNAV